MYEKYSMDFFFHLIFKVFNNFFVNYVFCVKKTKFALGLMDS